MANEQFAFIKKDTLPNRNDWQSAIESCGFDFVLNSEFNPVSDSGFLPCKLNGKDAGVELYFDDSEETLGQFLELAGDNDCCILFRWGGSMAECATAMIMSYALAKSYNAIISFEGEEPTTDLNTLKVETDQIIELAMKDF